LWPPNPWELSEEAVTIPDDVKDFLYVLLTGKTDFPEKVQRLLISFVQDLTFAVSGGRLKPPKHVLLPYAVKTLTNNVQLIQILNRFGHSIAYYQLEEINTALCLQKLATSSCSEVPLPENIHPFTCTTLAWDNIDRLEETLSGGGTSHRVNGIAVQASHFGPHLPPPSASPVSKSKRRSIESVGDAMLPIYNAGERCGPRPRGYVEVISWKDEAWKKDLLWILVRLHAEETQTIPSWNDEEVVKDRVGYLPTINAPATDKSTVYQILTKSVQIQRSLNLQSIAVRSSAVCKSCRDKVETRSPVSRPGVENGNVPHNWHILVCDWEAF